MRRIAIIIGALLAFCCESAWGGTIASVLDQSPQPVQGATGASTCVYPANVTSGDTLIIGAGSFSANLTTPTDTRTTTWTLVDSNVATNAHTYVWIGVVGSSGAETITLTGSVSFPKSVCLELPPSLGTLDVHANGSVPNVTTSFSTPSITTTIDGDFLFFYVYSDSSNSRTIPQIPLIPIEQNGSDSEGAGWGFAGVNTSYSANFTSVNGNMGIIAMALKPAAITIDTASLPSASTTGSYSYCLQARGGVGAYTWSITAGSLPIGLSLNGSTGCITGTPSTGTSALTFQVVGATSGTTTKSLTLTVNSSATSPSLIQGIAGSNSVPGSFTSVSIGDCLEVSVNNFGTTNLVYPTDTRGTRFQLVTSGEGPTSGSFGFNSLFAGTATSSGSDTVNYNANVNYIAAQFRNCQVFGDALSVGTGHNAGVATLTSSALTTPAPNSMIWAAYVGAQTGSTANAGSGYTADVTGTKMQGEHQLVSSAGSTAVTFAQTANTDGNWVITGLALRPSTSGIVSTSTRHKSQVF